MGHAPCWLCSKSASIGGLGGEDPDLNSFQLTPDGRRQRRADAARADRSAPDRPSPPPLPSARAGPTMPKENALRPNFGLYPTVAISDLYSACCFLAGAHLCVQVRARHRV